MLIPLGYIVAILLVIFITAVLYGREKYGILESCGIPVVPPTLFLGSEPDFHKKVHQLEDIKRLKKYGPIWGTYIGKNPQVHVADPDMIRLILVKDFDFFHNRQDVDFGNPIFNEILDFLPGEKWKTMRDLLSPLFTTAKIKAMSEVISNSAYEFIQDLKSECKDGRVKIDSRLRLSTWLIDMFAQATLGVRLEDSKNPENKFAKAFRILIGEEATFNFLYTLSLSFPFLTYFAPTFDSSTTGLIDETFRQIMNQRRASQSKSNKDFLDVLNTSWSKLSTPEFQRLKINEQTIIAQAINFFLGGFETSSTVLTHLLWYIANNPEIQDKMYKELEQFENVSKPFDYADVRDSQIPYITACINEALRLSSPLFRPERICTKDWTYGNIKIKKGLPVMIATWAVHRDPKFFPDPDSFKPERFLSENKNSLHPYAFNAFGHGPRNCIGMRFGYETMKQFLCNLIRTFTVELRPDSALEYKKGSLILVAMKPMYLDLVARKNKVTY